MYSGTGTYGKPGFVYSAPQSAGTCGRRGLAICMRFLTAAPGGHILLRMSRRAKGFAIAIIGTTIWSTSAVLVAYLLTHHAMPALLLAFWRDLLVCVALVPALALLARSAFRVREGQVRLFALHGLILSAFNTVFTFSTQANGAAVATVLMYSSAGFTVLLARWLFKEELSPRKALAVALSLSGCVMVSNAYRPEMWRLNPVGVSTGLLSGLLFAAYSLMGKESARRRINPWTTLLYSFGFGSTFLLGLNLAAGLARGAGLCSAVVPDLTAVGWLTLIALSFVPTLLGYGLYNVSMSYLPAGVVNLIATTEPAMTAAEAYVLLGERMSVVQIVGGLIILSAVLLVRGEKGTSH